MKFCGCLTVENDSRDENTIKYVKRYSLKRDLQKNNGLTTSTKSQKERTKLNASTKTESNKKQYTSKNQSSSESINKVVLRDNRHDISKRRSVTFANDSETEQRKFLRLNKAKRGSIDELQFNENKRAKSSPNVNHFTTSINTSYETTTCDELENSQQKKTTVRRRKRSKSPRKQLPSELLDAIKFDLVEPVGVDEDQLKTIPYENVKTLSQPIRISISSYSSRQQRRRRSSSPFNRGVVHSASSHMLHYQAQPTVVCMAQVKSTKVVNITQQTENLTADIGRVHTLNVQQDERIRLECTLTSKKDAEAAMWMRIRPPHNPDILTYRDSVVYAPHRIELEQRRLSSSMNTNGTFIDTYFLTLTILQPTIEDEGRYICSKDRTVFAEYDLFIIIPPQFIGDNNFIQQRTVIEGSSLRLSCSASGRPKPSITWFYRTNNGKHIVLGDGTGCLDKICELHLGNFTRDDPTIVECVASNEKSTPITKVFNIDVLFPPKLTTNVRTLIGSKNIEVFLDCLSIANPLSSITWLDDARQEIIDYQLYTIKTDNQSSILSFSISLPETSKVLFYCHSNNSIGTTEKSINISDFIQFDFRPDYESTTMQSLIISSSITPIHISSEITTTITNTTLPSNSSVSCYSNIFFLIFIICNFLKNIIYCTV